MNSKAIEREGRRAWDPTKHRLLGLPNFPVEVRDAGVP